ncbi:MAG: hypothetical protein Q9218_005921, partial [Villophora microphyllina]
MSKTFCVIPKRFPLWSNASSEKHLLTDQALASTIVPIHSDASTFTSVNTSPMEPLDYLDPPMELKIPLPDSDTPTQADLETSDLQELDGIALPDAALPESQEQELAECAIIQGLPFGTEDRPHQDSEHQERKGATAEQPSNAREEQTVHESVEVQPPIELKELRNLLRRKQYHRNHASSLQRALGCQTLACGLSGRLIPSHGMAYRTMSDRYQRNDASEFADIYHAAENLEEACAAQTSDQLLTARPVPYPPEDESSHPPFWLERLPQDCRDYVLDLITKLRTDEHFLASRLSALSFVEFSDLFAHSQSSRKPQSIFQMRFQRDSGDRSSKSSFQGGPSLLEKTRTFHNGDPFFVLFHGIFQSIGGSRDKEFLLKAKVWSTACAKVITEGKPGSDEFTAAVLDAFSDSSDWVLKPQLETYISRVLREGAFLVDPTSREPSRIKEPLEIHNANAAIAQSNFFDKALKDLLTILLDVSSVSMLPEGLLDFTRTLLEKISNIEIRHRARNFVALKWFVQSLVCRALTNPEISGIMMHDHINSSARTAILGGIANRLQKQVFDVIHSWYTTETVALQALMLTAGYRQSVAPTLDPGMTLMVRQLLGRFDIASRESNPGTMRPASESVAEKCPLMLSASDMAGLLRSLFPSLVGATSSTNPSTAGSSTLVPEFFHWDKENNSTTTSLSGISSAGTHDAKSGYLSSWNLKSGGTKSSGGGSDVTAPSNRVMKPSEEPDHSLIRTYRCLTANAQSLPTSGSEVFGTEWVFLEIGAKGQVFLPAVGYGAHENNDRYFGGPPSIDGTRQHPAENLQHAVVWLLTYEDQSALTDEILVEDVLECLTKAAVDRATFTRNYQDMHYWWQMQNVLRARHGSIDGLLRSIHDDCCQSIQADIKTCTEIQQQLFALSSIRKTQGIRLLRQRQQRRALRLKVWYASDVRHSSSFEDALHVTRGLRAMASTTRSKQASGVANWAKNRLRNVTGHDRSLDQTLEVLTDPSHHSGTCKLNDEQVERTTSWLTRNSVENFCRGEERIHRFCWEIRKCVNKHTGPTLLESPVLWSSRLFEPEKKLFHRKPQGNYAQPLPHIHGNIPRPMTSYTSTYSAITSILPTDELSSRWIPSSQLAEAATLGPSINPPLLDEFSPKEPMRSLPYRTSHIPIIPVDFVSSSQPPAYGSIHGLLGRTVDGKREDFLAEVKRGLCSLILSDLSYLLWLSGSETDAWIKQSSLDEALTIQGPEHRTFDTVEKQQTETPGSENARSGLQSLLMAATAAQQDTSSTWRLEHLEAHPVVRTFLEERSKPVSAKRFPYKKTFKSILETFSLSQDPHTKLRMLQELEDLVSHFIQESMVFSKTIGRRSRMANTRSLDHFNSRSISVPRTKATSFEEVFANCTERRAGTLKFSKPLPVPSSLPTENECFGTDEILDTLLTIFRDPDLRPPTLFRDLQFIAALVPAEILDQTQQGKAFWDAGLAALALKQELCDAMV